MDMLTCRLRGSMDILPHKLSMDNLTLFIQTLMINGQIFAVDHSSLYEEKNVSEASLSGRMEVWIFFHADCVDVWIFFHTDYVDVWIILYAKVR